MEGITTSTKLSKEHKNSELEKLQHFFASESAVKMLIKCTHH